MEPFAQIATDIFAWGTLLANIAIVLGVALLIATRFGNSGARLQRISQTIGNRAILWGFLVSAASVVASLFYSNVIGFAPCDLCWWQRIFLYPQAVIFGVALYRQGAGRVQDDVIFISSFILSIIGGAIALFQYYGQMFNPGLLAACATGGESCSKLFFVSLGYITIPMMSLTASLVLILLYFFHRRRA